MSDEGDGPRRDSDADDPDDSDDAFDFLDDSATETDDSAGIDDPFAELDAGVEEDGFEGDGFEGDGFEGDGFEGDGFEDDGFEDGDAGDSDANGFDPTDFDSADSTDHTDPTHRTDSDTDDLGADPSFVGDASDGPGDDPFDELGPVDEEADLADAFERVDVGDVAEEDVWESLDADIGAAAAGVGARAAPGEVDTEHVVAKRTYCQQCPHFTPPPEVACTHEGTSILEMVGFDEFRVRNCPMISEEDPTFDPDE